MKERILPRVERKYFMPTETVFGRGVLVGIFKEQPVAGAKKTVLVTGGHFKKSKEFGSLKRLFAKDNKLLIVFGDSPGASDFAGVNKLTGFVRDNRPDLVIAIGGGTVIDLGKSAAVLANNDGRVEDYLIGKEKIQKRGINYVAVPTTAGTGSEVTPWATVWDTENKQKYSLTSPMMFPGLAIVDPSLTDELPPKITAETGMDALTQAIEAFWSKNHNPVSDEYALKSIGQILANLHRAVSDPNRQSRDSMLYASLFAGLAFSNTKTTICHSLSYPMTARFGIAHGQAVCVVLPKMIEYSLPSLGEDREKALLFTMRATTAKEASLKVENLISSVGLTTRLSGLGIDESGLQLIISEGFSPDRMNNAPRIPSPQELKALLKSIL